MLNRTFHALSPLVVLALTTPVLAQDTARMDEVVRSFVEDGQFMGTVLVARDDDVVFSQGYGSANLEWDIPNTPSTKFRLGSVTKQFTAASILLLEERGVLSLEDPISTHLPEAPDAWADVTIFHLLTHTSGIPNFTSFPEYAERGPFPASPEEIVGWFREMPLEFAPGEQYRYSNSGYVLLGHLIETLTGKTYEAFVQDEIFDVLAMEDSGYDSNSRIIERRAAGYSPAPDGPQNAGFVHMSVPHAAGALYATTEDLLRWTRGLFGGSVISAASLDKMTEPFLSNYAMGVSVHAVDDRQVIDHSGGIQGFNTYLAYYPAEGVTVAVLANLNGPAPGEIAPLLARLAHGEEVQLTSEREETTVSPDTLSSYVGTYELKPGFDLVITLEDGQLMVEPTGQTKNPLFAESETRFFLKVVDAQLEFARDDAGTVTHVTLFQGPAEIRGTRK